MELFSVDQLRQARVLAESDELATAAPPDKLITALEPGICNELRNTLRTHGDQYMHRADLQKLS